MTNPEISLLICLIVSVLFSVALLRRMYNLEDDNSNLVKEIEEKNNSVSTLKYEKEKAYKRHLRCVADLQKIRNIAAGEGDN